MKRDGKPGRAWTKRGSLPAHRAPRLDTLEACREAWEERNPQGLWWGIIHCSVDGGLPQWLAAALLTMLKLRPVQRRFWSHTTGTSPTTFASLRYRTRANAGPERRRPL